MHLLDNVAEALSLKRFAPATYSCSKVMGVPERGGGTRVESCPPEVSTFKRYVAERFSWIESALEPLGLLACLWTKWGSSS